MNKDMTMAMVIIQVVFNYFGIPIELRDNPTRKRAKIIACQYSMYFLRAYTRLSFSEIAILFGRDHATAIHSCKKLDFEISKYRDAGQDAQNLEAKINGKIMELNFIIKNAYDDLFELDYNHYETDKV